MNRHEAVRVRARPALPGTPGPVIAAPLPHTERDRLAALASYRVLDTPVEAGFDDITSLAAAVWSTDASGFWHHALPLPNALALRGLAFVAQGAVIDPASPSGFALTQGLALAIGD